MKGQLKMTENKERDTRFLGFAKLLWADIIQSPKWPIFYLTDEEIEHAEQLIAQHAYDLVAYNLKHLWLDVKYDSDYLQELMQDTSDLTE
jgi:hypothetical protein